MTLHKRNLKAHLENLKRVNYKSIRVIEQLLNELAEAHKELECPKCSSGNTRKMIKGNIFCRNCGYDSREKNKK